MSFSRRREPTGSRPGLEPLETTELATARDRFTEALEIVATHPLHRVALTILLGVGRLLIATERAERGLTLLSYVQVHPASSQTLKDQAAGVLAHHPPRATPNRRTTNLERVVAEAHPELEQLS